MAGTYVCNTRINGDGTLNVHIEIPFGCAAEVTLPRSGKAATVLSAGSYDFHYAPERDYRKPFDETTPLSTLAENEKALGILFRLVPPLGDMAQDPASDFSTSALGEFRHIGFLPIDPEKLEQAIAEISNLIIE